MPAVFDVSFDRPESLPLLLLLDRLTALQNDFNIGLYWKSANDY